MCEPSSTTRPERDFHVTSGLSGYVRLLRAHGAWRFSLAGWFGRLNRVGSVVGTIVLLTATGTPYALAGVASAAVIVGGAIGGPAWSRAADRWGQRVVLLPAAGAALVAATAFTAAALTGMPFPVQVVAAFALGLAIADPGALVRARWMHLLGDRHDRHSALALETALDELAFLLGLPLLTAIAAALPGAGLLVAAALGAGGLGVLFLLRASIPPARPAVDRGAPVAAAGWRAWLPPGVAPVIPAFVGVGVLFGFLNLSGVAVSEVAGVPAAAGLVIGAFSLGAVAAGLLWGVVARRVGSTARLVVSTLAFVALVPLVGIAHDPVGFAVLAAIAGCGVTPLMIAATSTIEERAPLAAITVAMTWPPVAISAGNALGSIVTGGILDDGSVTATGAVPLLGVACALLALAVTLAARRAGRRDAARREPAETV